MIKLITKILTHESFNCRPPILLDIVESGDTFLLWKQLIPFFHLIAFEPNERKRHALEGENLIFINPTLKSKS
tara:strand:+ start:5910 stop:6128 length:219 start_codon:yes stop_codon:yes gene_type:complete